ncbi:MAG: tetratricopeptide repeat protein [Promethearchaeota archaeon]
MKKTTKKAPSKVDLIKEIKGLKDPIQYIKKRIEDIPLNDRAGELYKVGKKIANVKIVFELYQMVVKETNQSKLDLGTQIMELALDLPNCPNRLFDELGVIYTYKKKLEKALEVYEKAIKLGKLDPMYVTGIIYAAYPLGRQDIIDKYLDFSLKNTIFLNNPYSLSNVIYVLNRKETKKDSDLALKLIKNYWYKEGRQVIQSLYINMTDAYMVADAIDDTLEEIVKEVFEKIDEFHPMIFENIAWYYLKKDEINEAIYYLKQAKRLGHPGFQGLKTSKYFKKLWKNPDFLKLFD